jgi:hypothetical protein
MIGGGNRWTDFVKSFATKNKLSYMCALSTPECKIEYREKHGNPKKLSQKKEREMMGQEEALTKSKIKKQKEKVVSLSNKVDKVRAEKEIEKMGKEDVNVATPTQPVKKRGRPKKVKLIEPAVIEKKSRGRPKKYATAEEANKMKGVKTMEALKRRQAKAREEREMMAKEDKPNAVVGRKRGRPKKSGGMITPDDTPHTTPVNTPRPPLPHLEELIHLVQLDPTPVRLNRFKEIVTGNIQAYLHELYLHFDPLVSTNQQKISYERNIPAYRNEVIVLGAGRENITMTIHEKGGANKANIKDIRSIKERRESIKGIRRRIRELKEMRRKLFDEGVYGGDPRIEDINKTITALATNRGVTRELDREGDSDYEQSIDTQEQPYHTHRQNADDEDLVMGSQLDDSSGSDWSGEGMLGGHWTSHMLPHLEKELKNYQNIIHHLGQHLHEKGEHDPKDMIGFRHFTNEAKRIKKLMGRI